jgi:hypothetical protein
LDSRLTHQNSGVVIATVRVFLKYVDLNPDLQESVYFRIKSIFDNNNNNNKMRKMK